MESKADDQTSQQPISDAATEPAKKSRRTRWGQSASEAAAAAREIGCEDSTVDSSVPLETNIQSAPETPAAAAAAAASLVARAKSTLASDVATKAAAARAAVEKAKKALALQKQIQEQITAMRSGGIMGSRGANAILTSGMAAALRAMPTAKPFRFDRLGREIDAEGKVIEVKPLARSTLKVNINKEREAKLKQATFQTRVDRSLTNPVSNPWFDPNLPSAAKIRKKGLSFVERGFYTKKERAIRARELAQSMGLRMLTSGAKEEQKRRDAASDTTLKKILKLRDDEGIGEDESGGEDENPNLISLGGGRRKEELVENLDEVLEDDGDGDWTVYRQEALHLLQRKQIGIIPDVEWWDQQLLKKQSDLDRFEDEDPEFPYIIVDAAISDLVEHPVSIPPVVDVAKPVPPTLHLTPKERAKLRRRKRQEKEKDKRDKIRMGLMVPPPPRVKLANLHRVLGTPAAADPSKVEKDVREQVALRTKAHEERNEARKLDPEARRKKTISKWTRMPNEAEVPLGGAEVCVFSVASLSDHAHLFKVDKNAQQFHVTGAAIVCPQVGNLIIAEGSHKSLKGFKKLLLRRIQWEISSDATAVKVPNNDENQEENSPHCRLLWEGVVKDRGFKQWKVYPCKSESEVKKILSDRNSHHYWEMLKKSRPVAPQ